MATKKAAASKPAAAKKPAAKKRAPAKKKQEAAPEYVVNASDWSLYRSRELVHVVVDDEGNNVVAHADGTFEKMTDEELNTRYEPVKGLIKAA